MKKFLGILVLGLLWCNVTYAAFIYGKEKLPVVTKPEGANCTLKNNKGSWNVKTPGIVTLKLSKISLKVVCKKNGYKNKIINLPIKDKDSWIKRMAKEDPIKKDWAFDAVLDAIEHNPSDTLFNIGLTVVEKTIQLGAKISQKIKRPSTYANRFVKSSKLKERLTDYEIKKKMKDEGYYSLILIKLEKN